MKALVVAVGNAMRGDDGLGPRVAQILEGWLAPGAVVVARGEAASLLDVLSGVDVAWIVDAVRSGAPAGAILRLDLNTSGAGLPPSPTSSHAFGVAEAVGLGRALGQLPARLHFIGVEAGPLAGEGLSEPVEAAAVEVAREVAQAFAAAVEAGQGADLCVADALAPPAGAAAGVDAPSHPPIPGASHA